MAQLFLGAAVPGLRPNKRHIATHDSSGKSVYAESPEQEFWGVPNVGGMARSYAVSGIPAQLRDDADLKAYRADEGVTSYSKRDIVVPGNGANVVVVDIAPGGVSGMHHTVSIDFSICVMGEIEHELDSGQKVKLLPGVSFMMWSKTMELILSRITLYNEARCISGSMPRRLSRLDSWL